MNALNSVAVAISGLVFAGTAALTAGAALPANAQIAVSAPHAITSSHGKREKEDGRGIWQSNRCPTKGSHCVNVASSVSGDGNKVWSKPLQDRDEKGKYGKSHDRDAWEGNGE
jgi:hypothetical protein